MAPSPTISLELPGQHIIYNLYSVIYLGENHFTAQMQDSSDELWDYDGMWRFGAARHSHIQTAEDLLYDGPRNAAFLTATVVADVGICLFLLGHPLLFLSFTYFPLSSLFSTTIFIVIVGPYILTSQVYIPPILHPFYHVYLSPAPHTPTTSLLAGTNKYKQCHQSSQGLPITNSLQLPIQFSHVSSTCPNDRLQASHFLQHGFFQL